MAEAADKLVLVVDDDETMVALLAHIAGREGFKVESAADGREALKQIEAAIPDLIIMDLMMPNYGGFESLRRLQDSRTANIPIIIVTGRHNDSSTTELIRRESNVVDFFEKPLNADLLAAALHKALGTRPPES